METKRQLDVLDTHLKDSEYLCGNDEADYNIADMIIWAWYGQLVLGKLYDAAEFCKYKTTNTYSAGRKNC